MNYFEMKPLTDPIPYLRETEFETLIDWAYKRKPGARLVYHLGIDLLNCDHDADAYLLYECGRAHLMQRRSTWIKGVFEYIIQLKEQDRDSAKEEPQLIKKAEAAAKARAEAKAKAKAEAEAEKVRS